MLRRFHSAANVTMVSTVSLMSELRRRGFQNLGMWTRGVDTDLFAPHRAIPLDLPRPIFMTAGRIAVEKNLDAFLSLDLPGSKVVIGDGPQEAELQPGSPCDVPGIAERTGAGRPDRPADVFVFPSLTDTFGVVQLEALACGVPVAAFPVTGPNDVIGNHPVGVLNHDFRVPASTPSTSRGSLPRVCVDPFLGNERPPIHRTCQPVGSHGRTRCALGRSGVGARIVMAATCQCRRQEQSRGPAVAKIPTSKRTQSKGL